MECENCLNFICYTVKFNFHTCLSILKRFKTCFQNPYFRWPGFLVNRSGLPFDDLTWNELWEFAAYLYPEAKNTLREIQTAPLLQEVPFPYPPTISVAKQGI